ncbi:TIGR02536 family ethanolamine utilization protein [uncultured Clostridium sp.]|uniref:TIGR02536 family ethanolamine utilization protein n=1 Tax=uncultured Clostridium sp. TaxID=59620 RepID=UPI0032169C48
MNYDKLVDLIVKEVYKKLEEANKKNIRHKTAVIIGDVELDSITKANLNEEYRMIYYGEEALEADIAVVSRLSIKSMANIATLTGINEEENFIINMLLAGKRVYVLENGLEYRKYKNTAPRALYNKYLSFEKELKVYGIDIVEVIEKVEDKTTRKEEYKKVEEVSILETSNSISEEMSFEIRNKKLISEMDLRKPFMNGMKSVVIDKKSIITPLANDFIRIHNLKVKRV